jgi:hypothetical protein
MMEKEGNKSVGRWYKKKRGTPKKPPSLHPSMCGILRNGAG